MNFSELLEKNKKDIREDEARKRQSLKQLRELIKKHHFIRKCRQDDVFLLQFLRTRKYSIDATIKTFENHHLLRKHHPEWFAADPQTIDRFRSLIRSGFFYMLKDRDSIGSRVAMINAQKFDLMKFEPADALRCSFLGPGSILEDEENQIIGFTYILNYTNTPLSYFTYFSINDSIDWVKSTESYPARFKRFIIIGLPSYANKLFTIVKVAMSEKQRNRIILIDNYEELCQIIDPKILPEFVGGSQSEEKLIEESITNIDGNLEKLREINDFVIDDVQMKLKSDVNDSVGSFRKLEID